MDRRDVDQIRLRTLHQRRRWRRRLCSCGDPYPCTVRRDAETEEVLAAIDDEVPHSPSLEVRGGNR